MMREITTHHDGHGLAESIVILADAAGPGGASHNYIVQIVTGQDEFGPVYTEVARIQYQTGPRNEPGSTPGIIDSVLLAIVADRLSAFQAGPYACRENGSAWDSVEGALHWLKVRADLRAARGVLGKNEK